MLQFPAIPSWDALHPLIIHFPIALLLIAPIFIIVGAVLAPALLQAETSRSTAPIAVTARILVPVRVIRMVISSGSV